MNSRSYTTILKNAKAIVSIEIYQMIERLTSDPLNYWACNHKYVQMKQNAGMEWILHWMNAAHKGRGRRVTW